MNIIHKIKNVKSVVSRCCNDGSRFNKLLTTNQVSMVRLKSTEAADLLQPGTTYHGFQCTKSQYYADFNMSAYLLRHERLKTEYLHIQRNDNNNVFSVNFRTPVMDSTGLPHILEHITLCGSEKFPVRDPFFKMLNRSLATFMNAMTGPDYTLYPFSSTNEVDYRNLQAVYLDAVFKPSLKYLDFLQEGWRLENIDLNDRNSDLMFKGVVFNEMKGAFASNATVLHYGLTNNLLPDHTYAHISGGDPISIPNLSHKDLVAFHHKHYHPSNARMYSYGNFDVQKTLQIVNEHYLNGFDVIDREFSKVPKQQRWHAPKSVDIECRYDNLGAPIEKQCQIGIALITAEITDNYECLVLQVLSELLVRGPNSSFYKTLIEPNIIGGSFSQNTGFSSELKDTVFAVTLQNVQSKDFDLVCQLFEKTIDNVIVNGFDEAHVDSVLHSIELNLKHQSPKFGLHLLFNLTSAWNHDVDVLQSLNIVELLQQLRNNLKDKTYLQRKVKQYLRDNNHKLTLRMVPDSEFEQKYNRKEKQLLEQKTTCLTENERDQIYQNALELAADQKAPVNNVHLLPCLALNDIPRSIERNNIELRNENGISTQVTIADTNGVVYVHGICLCHHLSQEERLLLPLLTDIIAQMGTKKYSYKEFDTLVTSTTSGIQFSIHATENVNDHNQYQLGVSFGSFCLGKNTDAMFRLINDLLTGFDLTDVQRFSVLLDEYRGSLVAEIAQMGHLYAVYSSTSLLTEIGHLKSQMHGLQHIAFINKLCTEKNPNEILQDLKTLAEKLFINGQTRYALNVDRLHYNTALKSFSCLTQNTNTKQQQQWLQSRPFNGQPSCLHNLVTFPVNYCSKAFLTVPYVHEDYARLRVLAKIISAKYLLPVVREQNGAYGTGASIGQNGVFSYFSYRDPNSRRTLDVFDETYAWLQNNWDSIGEQALLESKLGVLQALDAPIEAGFKGLAQFKHGITDDLFAKHREQVLNVTLSELHNVAEKYFAMNMIYGKSVVGPDSNEQLTKSGEKLIKDSGEY